MDLLEEQGEDVAATLKDVLPGLNCLTLVGKAFSPDVHHVAQVVVVASVMLKQHIADAFL